ncbi:hypothetical protein AVEN_108883-1, partial [Araneus ventricosus]
SDLDGLLLTDHIKRTGDESNYSVSDTTSDSDSEDIQIRYYSDNASYPIQLYIEEAVTDLPSNDPPMLANSKDSSREAPPPSPFEVSNGIENTDDPDDVTERLYSFMADVISKLNARRDKFS